MNAWLIGANVLLLSVVPLGIVLLSAPTMDRLVALEVAGVDVALALVLLAMGYDRSIYADLALVLATLSVIGGLAFVRFLERWL